jgi:hypothetical protein
MSRQHQQSAWRQVSPFVAAAIFGAGLAVPASAATFADPLRSEADCLIRRDLNAAFQFAAAVPGSARESTTWQRLQERRGRCHATAALPSGALEIDALAGAIAERLYLSLVGKGAGGKLDDPAAVARGIIAGRADWPPAARAFDCVIMQNLGAADRLLRSTPGGSSESSAIDAIVASLPVCIVADEKLAIGRSTFRAGIARALLRQIGIPTLKALRM